MSENKDVLVRWFDEIWNQGRVETIEELMLPDAIIHDSDTHSVGPEEFRKFYDRMRSAFDEIQLTTHEIARDGDLGCIRWSATMRHSGDGLGMPATGKQVNITGISVAKIRDGRLAEAWQNWDALGMLRQIEAAPAYADVAYMGAHAKSAV